MIMSDSNISDEDFDSELDQTGYFSTTAGDYLYLFIETLTGTSFEMRVSPLETVVAIKAKLQQLEGIPVNQQHLLYNNRELPNNSSLIDSEIPDGATLKLVLAMRGGPINTRKIPVPDETAREIQEAVDRSKDDFLGQIPEGGHVTVLVFRDGDEINLYHVLERPDGSYSPLSDSLSGSSIRNLFAEPDDAEVQARIQENANTMTKMQELKNKMETMNVQKSKVVPRRRGVVLDSVNLPPIAKSDRTLWSQTADRAGSSRERGEMTTITELGRTRIRHPSSRGGGNHLPDMNLRHEANIDFSDTPPLSKRNSSSDFVFGNPVAQRQSVLRTQNGRRQSTALPAAKPASKMISVDIGELKRNVDDNEGFNPSRRTQSRAYNPRTQRRRLPNRSDEENAENDIFIRNPNETPRDVPSFLAASQTSLSNVERYLHSSSGETELRQNLPRLRSSRHAYSEPNIKLTDDQTNGNLCDKTPKVPSTAGDSKPWQSSVQTQLQPFSIGNTGEGTAYSSTLGSEPKGLERRLLNSRRGKLSRTVASAARIPRLLASPKGQRSPRTPRSGDKKSLPTFQTRPLSGPKKTRSSKPRCPVPGCRKKLTITNSFTCRCGDLFCPQHRHPETHACTFDYKTEGRKILEANNPMISIPKLPKI